VTPARALVHRAGFVAWHDGILDAAAGLFAYHDFVACHRVPRVVAVNSADVIRVDPVAP
jgi:hypothetical protein